MYIHGYSASVVGDGNASVFTQYNIDPAAISCQVFIYAVIKYFPNKVMQSSGARTSDVHAGTLSDRFETFENYYLTTVILFHVNSPNLFIIIRECFPFYML
jgi:hypothetical protein